LTFFISTGSALIDSLLGGGVRSGMLTDVYGQSGSGKSQLCFTLCVNCIKSSTQEDKVIFIDTTGTFRPERIAEISSSYTNSNLLNKIMYVRALSTLDQVSTIRRIATINPRLVIVDSATYLFSTEFKGVSRHLALMKYLHEVSLAAINFDCAIVVTNMVRNMPLNKKITQSRDHNIAPSIKPSSTNSNTFGQREFMGTSVSIYAHMKLKLAALDRKNAVFGVSLMQPKRKGWTAFHIASRGICD
jgi:hypothetical protein